MDSMTDSEHKEIDAFFSFFATFDLTRPVTTVADLGDGAALFEILSTVSVTTPILLTYVYIDIVYDCRDADYFQQPTRPSTQPSDNWILRFSSLKRVYRLMTQYFSDVLHQPTSDLEVPDLQAVAKNHDLSSTLLMCRLTIAIAVQCEKNKEFIEKIQRLTEANQHFLMKAIEQASLDSRSVDTYVHDGFPGHGEGESSRR
jgi:protein HOOK3